MRIAAARSATSRIPVLEQIAGASLVSLEQPERVLRLDVLGEDEHADGGMPFAQLLRGGEAFVGVRRRHPNVDDRDVRVGRGDRREQLIGVARLGDDVEALPAQQLGKPFAQEDRVLGQRYAHGSSTRIVVPVPLSLSIHNEPPSA